MLTFKRWVKIVGYLSAIFFFAILTIVFFGFVTKDSLPDVKIVKIKSKAKAKSVDIWRTSNDGLKKYRLVAYSMVKTKNDLVVLRNATLWYFEKNEPGIYIKATKAVIDTENNIEATGEVVFKRKDLKLYTTKVNWINSLKILRGSKKFNGQSTKVSFSGKSFIYYVKLDKLVANGVSVWLK